MSLAHSLVWIVLLGFFCFLGPVAIYMFARCFTGRGWTFMDFNTDAPR
jgi:hypothetical protein